MFGTLCKRSRIALASLAALSGALAFSPTPVAASAADSSQRTSYVLFDQGSSSISMSGSSEDLERARALRRGEEALLYVREGGAVYVIRDAATLDRAEALFEPQRALGARQGELGRRQGELGRRQGALGAEQARLGRRQANARASQAGELGRQQGELGRRQAALGSEQAELGRQQGELGREQARLARQAEAALRDLVADARERGLAQAVN